MKSQLKSRHKMATLTTYMRMTKGNAHNGKQKSKKQKKWKIENNETKNKELVMWNGTKESKGE